MAKDKKRVEFTRKKKKITIKKSKGRKSGPKSSTAAKAKAASLAKIEKEFPVELMLTDWSVRHPDLKPLVYLTQIKGYTDGEARSILNRVPTPDWYTAKQELIDGMTASLAKRQIDWAAEMHDLHFEASKIGIQSVVEWLNHQSKQDPSERDMRMLKTAMDAVATAQKIQRTALGLPTDDGAIHIYNNLIMKQQQITHVSEDEKTPVEKLEERLTVEEVKALIEIRRIEKAREAAIDVEAEPLPS